MIRYDVIFTGRVQGVFFRATAHEVARRFEVSGWIQNEYDGSVRMVAEGAEAELDRFLLAVRDAKKPNIDDVRTEKHAATGEFTEFAIRR